MGIRETLNRNPGITTGATIGIILIALIFIVWNVRDGSQNGDVGMSFFTIDDGKNWFPDDANQIPPIEKGGKPAYRCYVYRCADGTEFVSHLERFIPEAKKRLEEARQKMGSGDPMIMEDFAGGIEVKDPGTGDKGWTRQIDPRAMQIMSPRCPKDGSTEVTAVFPD